MLESELARSKDEIAQLKQQLVESQAVEKERKKLADKVERLEGRVRRVSHCPVKCDYRREQKADGRYTAHRWKT